MFSFNHLDYKTQDINQVLISDREKYSKYYEKIEAFIACKREPPIILGGDLNIAFIKNSHEILDCVYELYSESAFKYANDLVNSLVGNYIVSLRITSPNYLMEIIVNNRPLVKFYQLQRVEDKISLEKMVVLPMRKTNNNFQVHSLPIFLELLHVYHDLYNVEKIDSWAEIIKQENTLFQELNLSHFKIQEKYLKNIQGGNERKQLLLKFLKEFHKEEFIILGETALAMLTKTNIGNTLSLLIPVHISKTLDGIYTFFTNLGYSVNITKTRVKLIHDKRLVRHNVKVAGQDILYIFNSMEYEVVPYLTMSYKNYTLYVANPFVLMRWIFLDIWIIYWLKSVGKVHNDYAEKRIADLLEKYLLFRSQFAKNGQLTLQQILEKNNKYKFFTSCMQGVHYPQMRFMKKIKNKSKYYPEYFPEKYWLENKKFREIQDNFSENN